MEEKTSVSMNNTELVIKVVAMPCDTNPDGDIFGGWILSQMDLAAYLYARKFSHHKVVTAAIDNIVFHSPVEVGDCLICYATTEKRGHTSITVKINVVVERKNSHRLEQVTEGCFVLVAIDQNRSPIALK